MPDEKLDTLTGPKYVELLNAVRPDVAMILDCYTYIDDPLALSWSQLFRLVDNALYAVENADIPLLGIAKGANPKQVAWWIAFWIWASVPSCSRIGSWLGLARQGRSSSSTC